MGERGPFGFRLEGMIFMSGNSVPWRKRELMGWKMHVVDNVGGLE
jgi:hypothetical protein